MKNKNKSFRADAIGSYFRLEWLPLLFVTLSGLVYNVGLLAGPWYEGRLAQCLADILGGNASAANMAALVLGYILVTLLVQTARFIKRFYVRRFANNINRRIKGILYASLVRQSRASLEKEGAGELMTKAISDVDDCAEGMRKFTTEIFDTGIALAAYTGMLLRYDWRLALLCLIFPPISYMAAEKMKKAIQKAGAAYKEQSGMLSAATLDRAQNAVTYRVFGREEERRDAYEENLTAYEKAAVRAQIWNASMQPLYRVISMTGVGFILYFGQKNVLGTGWQPWSIAAFTTFLSCFTKLSVKSSSAAKLFNAVHKAQVSWNRIKPLLAQKPQDDGQKPDEGTCAANRLEVEHLSLTYPDGKKVLNDISFTAEKGQIIGITGPVACGKSTLGRAFLCEYPYEGAIRIDGRDLQRMKPNERAKIIGYLGHDPELFNDTIENNILMGEKKDAGTLLKMVCMEKEVAAMDDAEQSLIGSGGVRLSGGQGKRLALARTLCHPRPILILDDPFSALDRPTERKVFAHLREQTREDIVLLISHRLYLFPKMDRIIWMEDGKAVIGTHEELLVKAPAYRELFVSQTKDGQKGGEAHEA